MNKKIVAAIGVSGALLMGSVFSISANTSGYDLYKSALKQTHSVDSATINMKMSVTDNENRIFSADSTFKSDSVKEVSEVTTLFANQSEATKTSMHKQDGNMYVMSDRVDTIYQMDLSKNPHHSNTAELHEDVENLIDVMTKNLQQQIAVQQQKDGDYLVELHLEDNEIPLSVNALSTLMLKHAALMNDSNQDAENGANFHLDVTIPELDHDIALKEIKLNAVVNKENQIEEQNMTAVVVGKDKNEKQHELVLTMEIDGTDYNQTKVSPVSIPTENVVLFDHSTVGK